MGDWDVTSEAPADGAWAVIEQTPQYKGRPGVRAALKVLQQRYGRNKYGASDAAAEGFTLGLSNLSNAGIAAGLTAAERGLKGGKLPYTARDMFDASRLLQDAKRSQYMGQHPVRGTAASILGAVGMPGGEAVAKFVVGKVAPALAASGKSVPAGTRALQTARAAGVGGALTGAQAAATARPGEEVERAKSGALTGAVLAPLTGAGVAAGTKVAPVIARTARRMVGRGPTPEAMTLLNLQRVLRKGGVAPEAIQAASDEWQKMGGVTPALIDLIKDAGGSPEVLHLLGRSGAKAPARRMAEKYAEETVTGTQAAAIKQAEALPTGGETRTPSQIKADLEARYSVGEGEGARRSREAARRDQTKATTVERRGEKALSDIDATAERQLSEIDANQAQASRAAPESPVAKESGAAAFAEDLNKKYDASETAYKRAYTDAENAAPEAAVIDAGEVRPLFDKLRTGLKGLNPDLEGVGAVNQYLEKIKRGIAPGETADWPEGEAMDNAAALTVQQLEFLRQKMVELAEKHGGKTGGAAATRVKAIVDSELERLAAENKITGDPAVVDKWKTAILGYADHMKKFGSGLAAELTARKPDGTRVVEPFRAADVVFGTAKDGARNLNTVLSELDPALDIASPEAAAALRHELYGRVKPEDLPKLRATTGGKKLLPEDLTDEALAAQEATKQAEAAAQAGRDAVKTESAAARDSTLAATTDAKALAEMGAADRQARIARETASRLEPTKASQSALEIGEGALSSPSEEFTPAVSGVANQDLPIVAAGAKQSVLNALERKAPQSTSVISDLTGAQASRNLGLAISPADVARMQARMTAIQKQGQNAQQLEAASRASSVHTDPIIDNIGPADIAYPKRGVADVGFRLWRLYGRLNSQKEYEAGLKILADKDPAAVAALLSGLVKKYPAAKRALSPFLTRPAASEGDPGAMDRLKEEYGVP